MKGIASALDDWYYSQQVIEINKPGPVPVARLGLYRVNLLDVKCWICFDNVGTQAGTKSAT